jgi:O-antigen ligase
VHVAKGIGAGIAVLALAAAVAVWPVTTTLAVLVTLVLLLAWRRPALALVAAVLLVGLEGSVKVLLTLEPDPFPVGERALGAAAIDLALFAAVLGVLARDRLRTPRAVWAGATRSERVVLGVLAAWFVLSVLQIAWDGELTRGVKGFRLFQAYVLVGVAAGVAAAGVPARRLATALLAVGGIVAAYAALRVIIGPAAAEKEFATVVSTVVGYGDVVRGVGSFSSAVGLGSFLTPVLVFALVAGLLVPALRIAAWGVAVLAAIGVVGSYGRSPLVAAAAGLLFAVLLIGLARDVTRQRKLVVAGVVVAAIAGTYGGVLVAAEASERLRERAHGLVDPFGDPSVQLRLDTWERIVDGAADRPLGHGIGAVGSASADERADFLTADNSYLKVLYEQGFLGIALFVAGLGGVLVLLTRRVLTATGEARAVGLAALAGVVGFLALAVTGEYVEQPGKVYAWALLGVAAACVLRPAEEGPA